MHQLQQKHIQNEGDRDVELQINITLGKVKYSLRVENVTNLPKLVQDFISQNQLNKKYYQKILSMVQKSLEQKEAQNHQNLIKIQKQNRLNQSLKKSCRRNQAQNLSQNQHAYNYNSQYYEARQKIDHNRKERFEKVKIQRQMSPQSQAQRRSRIKNTQLQEKNDFSQENSLQKQNFKKKTTQNQKSKQKIDLKQMMLFRIQQELNQTHSTTKKYQNYFQNTSPKNQYKYSQNKVNSETQISQEIGSKQVYEKWKTKQKIKNQKGFKNNKQNQNQYHAYQNEQNEQFYNTSDKGHVHQHQHDQDWFYKKGLYLQQEKQKHNKKLFDQIYPFTTLKEVKISQNQKQQLHNRLFKDKEKAAKEIKMVENHLNKNQHSRPNNNKFWNSQVNVNTIKGLSPVMKKRLLQKNNQIKQKIKQKDNQIDVALDQMIRQGLVKSPCTIRKVSLSPFRRTILK